MNAGSWVFKDGKYEIFPVENSMLFNIYHVEGLQAELMIGGFKSLAEAIEYLRHPNKKV